MSNTVHLPTLEEYSNMEKYISRNTLYSFISAYDIESDFTATRVSVFRRKERYDFVSSPYEDARYLHMLIGASQASSLIVPEESFVNPRILFMEKLGFIQKRPSRYILMGKIFEEYLKDLLSYMEEDVDSIFRNKPEKKRVREVYDYQDTYILFINGVPFRVTPDFGILINGAVHPIDTKFLSRYSFQKNELSMLPGSYVWQSILQQLTLHVMEGYMFYVVGNEDLTLRKISLQEYIPFLNTLSSNADEFYKNLIKASGEKREEVVNIYYKDYPLSLGMYDILEPAVTHHIDSRNVDPFGNIIYSDTINGDTEDISFARSYVTIRDSKSELEKEMENIKNTFRLKYPSHREVLCEEYKVVLKDRFNVKVNTPPKNGEEL